MQSDFNRGSDAAKVTVVDRLKRRLGDARMMGFRVRMEVLDQEQPSWCVIAGEPVLFVDLSVGAAEQLRQVDEMLESYADELRRTRSAA